MIGETAFGYCFRENSLWYGDIEEEVSCRMPLCDGLPCGDRDNKGPRCPYNKGPHRLHHTYTAGDLVTYKDYVKARGIALGTLMDECTHMGGLR